MDSSDVSDSGIDIEIPYHFLCPISIQLMKDPVTVSTGITYDRESIEKWLFSFNNTICPVTKQSLQETDLTPNLTLQRLIQHWCILNSHDRIPSPKPPMNKSQITKLLNDATKSPQLQLFCLHRLRSIAQSDNNFKNYLQQSNRAVDFLLSVLTNKYDHESRDEALNILQRIGLSDQELKKLVQDDNGEIMSSLTLVLETGNIQTRANAVLLLQSIFKVADPSQVIGCELELFVQIVRVLRDSLISQQVRKAAIKLLIQIVPFGRNKIKAVQTGSVHVLIELLLECCDKRTYELVLIALEQLCGCADGRAELLKHGAGLAVVSKKVLRVSQLASERAVRIIQSICKHSSSSKVVQEMLQVGVVTKLCLVLQVEIGEKTKERVKDVLRLHSRVWKGASCVPPHFNSSYPSSK